MLITVFFYSSIVIVSALFVYLSENSKKIEEKLIMLFFAFLVVFIPAAIRYNIGTDFLAYIDIFENIEQHPRLEAGFYYSNYFLKMFGFPSQTIIALMAFVFSLVALVALPREKGWVVYFAFMLVVYFFSFNVIRQAVAVAFSLLAIGLFLRGSFFQFVFWVCIGGLFHKSVFLLLPIGALCQLQWRNNAYIYIFQIIGIFALLIFYFYSSYVFHLMKTLLEFSGAVEYASYFDSSKHFVKAEIKTGVGVIGNILFACYFILRSKSLLEYNYRANLLILIALLYALSLILTSQIVIFNRMLAVFYAFPAYAMHMLLVMRDRYRQLDLLVAFIYGLLLFLLFIKNSFGFPDGYTNPLLNPYKVFFAN
ncbi:EpsG family protein [Stutzerimonas stutzeri]|uniref:EpsG family protein n=1 Tax=Stutzerimonas stutzeri TaxID=316 RepID=UPI0024B7B444|nr:EpsG family protein [Stutzerimonas stutzeri]MDI9738109.1 EpsG family protein [Stutzerimonas stutzeri]